MPMNFPTEVITLKAEALSLLGTLVGVVIYLGGSPRPRDRALLLLFCLSESCEMILRIASTFALHGETAQGYSVAWLTLYRNAPPGKLFVMLTLLSATAGATFRCSHCHGQWSSANDVANSGPEY